jgi:hypothetical protein
VPDLFDDDDIVVEELSRVQTHAGCRIDAR